MKIDTVLQHVVVIVSASDPHQTPPPNPPTTSPVSRSYSHGTHVPDPNWVGLRPACIKSNTLNSSAVIRLCRWPLREKEEEQVHLQAANKQEVLKTRITRRKKKAKLLDLPTTITVLQESSLLQQKQNIRVLARLWCTEHFYTILQNKENFVAVEMSRQEHWQNLPYQSVNISVFLNGGVGVSLLSSWTPIRLGKAQIFIVLENGMVLSILLCVFSETFATVKNPS